ncbi:probable galacturonosyltransferase 15 [Telopea speciosissima]|uniref:probable galacturonosyltransferase 15 n=1 Tax=Telopea speciosissima TaxID=54955 RepID=UPI001CC404A4|nr:probable galacturonosyltransferase 15 [Telopea speciosissima]
MKFHITTGTKSLTISGGGGCFWEVMKVKGSMRRFSYRSILPTVLILGIVLPFLFIRTAFLALESASSCSSLDCFGRKFGPSIFGGRDASLGLADELTRALTVANEIGVDESGTESSPASFNELVTDITSGRQDIKGFAFETKAMLMKMERRVRLAKHQELIYRHHAAYGIPKSMYCLCLRLAEEYSINALARSPLPPPEAVSRLADPSYHHVALLTDNILAASVVVSSAASNAANPEKLVFHIVTDKKTYAPMHAWFALNSAAAPAVVEVKGLHQFDWSHHVNVGVKEMMEIHRSSWNRHYKNLKEGKCDELEEGELVKRLEDLNPSCLSLMNHLRIYLPKLFPELNKVIFLDDDVVVQQDLSPLWALDLDGKVVGAVVNSWSERKYGDYFNFSNSLVSSSFEYDRCAWSYGMNVFNLKAWRSTNITETYHHWLKLNLDSGFTLWRPGALPPALIAFEGYVHPIDPSWHAAGLGQQPLRINRKMVEAAAVIHFSGPAKPWLDIGLQELRGLWNTHINFTNEFIMNCRIMA